MYGWAQIHWTILWVSAIVLHKSGLIHISYLIDLKKKNALKMKFITIAKNLEHIPSARNSKWETIQLSYQNKTGFGSGSDPTKKVDPNI